VAVVAKALLLAVVTALAVGAGGAAAPTLFTDRNVVTIATGEVSGIILSGSVPGAGADDEVVIEAKECGRSSFVRVHAGHTDAAGAFHERLAPLQLTTYRARARGEVSAPVTVRARPAIRFAHVQGKRFYVWMLAMRFFDGAKGRLERFDRARGRWVLVRRVTLRRQSGPTMARSGADFSAPVRRGWVTRFVLPRDQAGACYLAGYSLLVTVR
jgi:hypothetical protein